MCLVFQPSLAVPASQQEPDDHLSRQLAWRIVLLLLWLPAGGTWRCEECFPGAKFLRHRLAVSFLLFAASGNFRC